MLALFLRLLIPYVVLLALRVVFYLYNIDSFGTLESGEIADLLRGALIFDSANIAYTYGLFIVLSLLPFRSRAEKWYQTMLFWIFSLATAAVVFFNSCDTVYFHYAKKRGTIDEFSYAENGNTFEIMVKSAFENWYLLLFAIALTAGAIWIYRKIPYRPLRLKRGYYPISILILGIGIFTLVTAMRGGIGRAIRPITLSNAAHFAATPQKASIVLSNPFCILRTLGNSKIRYSKYFSDIELDSLYQTTLHPSDSAIQPRKNIVIMILESFSYEHSTYLNPELHSTENYTPFLDSLMQQGYLYRKAYANGRKSIDALPSILTSIPSFKTPFALLPAALSPIKGLGTLLKEDGYSSWFFNGSEERSMGFVAFARTAGFDNIRTRENYESLHGNSEYDNYWGIWDEPFLQYMASELNAAPEPFVASTFTLSSHHPFVVPDKYKDQLPQGKTAIQRPVAYTDLAVRHFFDYAKQQPWYPNTIFVFVADHVSSETQSPETRTATGNSHILYFMYTPDGSLRGDTQRVTQQIDIMPTLLSMVGYSKPFFAFGRNSMDDSQEGFAVNYTGSSFQWIDSDRAYIFDEKELTNVYDLASDKLQTHNIVDQTVIEQQVGQRKIEAFIQKYYQTLENRNFTPTVNK